MSKQYTQADIRKKLDKALTSKRYTHTLGVAGCAASLAMAHGADIEKANLAGMLHDCAKCIDIQKQFKLCKKYNIELSEAEKQSTALIHAKLGAYIAKNSYGVEDEEVLSAIRWHTTGKPEMTLLEKIVYIADYIEPGRRDIPRLDEIRKMAFKDIDETMVIVLKSCLEYLESKNAPIDPVTQETYDYYVKGNK